ncbi:hypothetical protein IWQ55_006188 [Labrenzia sp. EL_208]|nr:hypothetical protein [Labrenzia sp. EL_132]MBG6211546.1 hypothetical protein [Labrenzia sp. EL_126]MBG6232954.1 hypothetical protein [Labrenzia sp. EL_208]
MSKRQWSELSPQEKAGVCRHYVCRKGLSSTQAAIAISGEYGPVTRNSVIGTCHRNNIPMTAGHIVRSANEITKSSTRNGKAARKAKPKGRQCPGAAETRPKDTPSSRTRTRKEVFNAFEMRPERESAAEAEGLSKADQVELGSKSLRAGGAVSLADLGPRTCRWPVWSFHDKPEGGGSYCGAACETEDSYCGAHKRLAYVPPERRPKKGSRLWRTSWS